MADRTARSVQRLRADIDHRPQLKLIAGARDGAPLGKPAALVAPVALPPVLSPSADIFGVSRAGWSGAAVLYAALATALLVTAWSATPPAPWPDNAVVYKVVFEEPPPPAPPVPASEPKSAAPAPEAAPPEPPLAKPEPAPPLQAIAEPPQDLPKPPPPKPAPPRQHTAAPASATPPRAPTEQQVATVTPPVLPAAPVLPPEPVGGLAGNRKPDYPPAAKLRGQQGRVVLRVEVSPAGAPLSVAIVATSGHVVLDKAALAAVEQWRFKPATQAGTPVVGAVDVPIQFRLEE